MKYGYSAKYTPEVRNLLRDRKKAERFICQQKQQKEYYLERLEEDMKSRTWQPIETAPKDGTTIIGWCVHDADPYYDPEFDGKRLTPYGSNAEGMSYVDDGVNLICWHDVIHEDEYIIPAWWCLADGYGETAANPTHWMPLPEPPENEVNHEQRT